MSIIVYQAKRTFKCTFSAFVNLGPVDKTTQNVPTASHERLNLPDICCEKVKQGCKPCVPWRGTEPPVLYLYDGGIYEDCVAETTISHPVHFHPKLQLLFIYNLEP